MLGHGPSYRSFRPTRNCRPKMLNRASWSSPHLEETGCDNVRTTYCSPRGCSFAAAQRALRLWTKESSEFRALSPDVQVDLMSVPLPQNSESTAERCGVPGSGKAALP